MLLKDALIGQTCVVEKMNLPFQLERRLEALANPSAPGCAWPWACTGKQCWSAA